MGKKGKASFSKAPWKKPLSWWASWAGILSAIFAGYQLFQHRDSLDGYFVNIGSGRQTINQGHIDQQNNADTIILNQQSPKGPIIELTPKNVFQFPQTTQVVTFVDVVNSGDEGAYEILIDGRYGNGFWTSEWAKAKRQSAGGHGAPGQLYSTATSDIARLDPGEASSWRITNAMDLESEVCSAGNNGFPVEFRMVWQDKRKHRNDQIYRYRLVCTRDTMGSKLGDGRSFSFFPATNQDAASK